MKRNCYYPLIPVFRHCSSVQSPIAWIIAALALACLVRPLSAQAPAAASAPSSAAAITISIIGTNDVHGYVLPAGGRGGLAWFGGFVQNLRAARARDAQPGGVLLLDAGDTFQGGIESNLSEGGLVVDAYNALGYAAAAIGNHEFDFGGLDQFDPADDPDPRGAIKAIAARARYPVLAGQTARYLYLQLRDFAAGRRWDPQMSPTAAGLSEPEMRGLAQWYAQQAQVAPAYEFDALKVARGKAKADEVLCTACHLGGYVGQNEVPRIAGQHYAYVVKQLRDFRARRRTDDAGAMTSLSDTLSEADIENLAHYLASL